MIVYMTPGIFWDLNRDISGLSSIHNTLVQSKVQRMDDDPLTEPFVG